MSGPRPLLAAWSALALALVGWAPAVGGQLDFDILFGDNPGGRLPEQIAWAPDGARLSYVWDDGEGEALWVLDLASAQAIPRLRRDELAVDAHRWSPDGTRILVESAGSAHLLRLDDGSIRQLTEDGGEEEATFSPDGGRVAFVRDHDLHVVDLATGEVRALTTDGDGDRFLNAVTDWVYWEELWNRDSTGFWWSPDGSRIAYYRFDEEGVGRYPLIADYEPTHPEVRWQRYPKAGEALPRVTIGVLDLDSGDTVWMETAEPEKHYFPRVHWRPDGERLVVAQLAREQDRLELLSCVPASGACEPWMAESWPTWINLHDDFRWLPDGGFLWSSEKNGFRALYLHGPDGPAERRLTPRDLAVASVRGFNAAEGWVVFDGFRTGGLGAKDRAVYRQSLAGGQPSLLSPPAGTHRATVDDRTGAYVLVSSDADTPSRASLRNPDGTPHVAELPWEGPEEYVARELPRWEFLTIPGPDEARLPAAMLRPAGFDPARRYPVIMYHYGCPSSQVVTDAWGSRGRGLWHKMMAERGFLVLAVDNPASRFFGKQGEDRAFRSFGPGNLAAQRAAVDFLRSLPFADAERIGLWGWSGGGYNTLYALTHAPGVWKAGVAGAPVSDWRFYDAIWTERYMDTPADNPDGYAAASALDAAAALEDALLIVHGTADDNVHPQNSLAMAARLVAAGKPFEQAIHPRQKHGFRGEDSRHFYERMTEFFERHLAPPASAAEPAPEPEVAPTTTPGAPR